VGERPIALKVAEGITDKTNCKCEVPDYGYPTNMDKSNENFHNIATFVALALFLAAVAFIAYMRL
jgi:hypothetical protein